MSLLEEYGIKPDQRFLDVHKEAKITLFSWALYTAWCWGWAIFGSITPVEEYKYILGMPQWFFMTIIVYASSPIICWIVTLMIKDCTLSANGKDDVVDLLEVAERDHFHGHVETAKI